jgi:hypothetical protein
MMFDLFYKCRVFILLTVAVAVGQACILSSSLDRPSQKPVPSFFLGGIQVNEPDHAKWTHALTEVGMNTVAVTIYARQGDWDSDNLWYDEEAKWVVHEIRAAKQAGLHVVLILRVALDHAYVRNRFLWHGMIMPRTPTLLRSWFLKYREFANKWALIAEKEGVDVFGVGSELNALTSTTPVDSLPGILHYFLDEDQQQHYREALLRQEERLDTRYLRGAWGQTYNSLNHYIDDRARAEHAWAKTMSFGQNLNTINERRSLLKRLWVELIQELRTVYSGPLTYAANFDQYHEVTFWKELDYIGINAYFPLRAKPSTELDPTALYPVLEDAWVDILQGIENFRQQEGLDSQPVIFTELGYTFRLNSTIEPWASDGFSLLEVDVDSNLIIWEERRVNYQERALAVRALRQAANKIQVKRTGQTHNFDYQNNLLRGILYWKLSTLEEHEKIEPFVLIVGPHPPDPLLAELLAFM